MKKILVTILLTASLAVCLSACGSDANNNKPADSASASEEQTSGNAGIEGTADTEEDLSAEEVEVMVPEGPVEEMEPQENIDLEIEEGLAGSLG